MRRRISPFSGDLSASLPIYTTRPSAEGDTATYSQSIWMTLLFQLVVWLNGVLWGVYGVIQAVQHIF